MLKTIPAQSGTAFLVKKGERIRVRSPHGKQVSDLFCFNADDHAEHLSTARSMDAADTIFLSTHHELLSNRARAMLKIIFDSCGRHDLLMPPCREAENGHPGCFENLSVAFSGYGILPDQVGTAFNLFMHVDVDNGRPIILPPKSMPGDEIVLEAQMDVLVGLTACAHLATNGGELKPIHWAVEPSDI